MHQGYEYIYSIVVLPKEMCSANIVFCAIYCVYIILGNSKDDL